MDRIFGNLNLNPVSMRDIAYQSLRQAIIDGRLRPGERLIEETLASMLEVSRTPLREAIQKLEQEGWVNRLRRGGVQVNDLSVGEIENLYKTRAVLEGLTTREAVEKRSDELVHLLSQIMTGMEAAANREDVENVVSCGKRFHAAIHQASGNSIATELLHKVIDHIARYRQLGVAQTRGRSMAAVSEHQRILDRVIAGDADGAEAEMRRHVMEGSYAVIGSIRAAANQENETHR